MRHRKRSGLGQASECLRLRFCVLLLWFLRGFVRMGRIVSYRIVAVPGTSRDAKAASEAAGTRPANARVSLLSRRRGEQRGEGIGVQRAAEVPGSRGARERLVRGCVQLAASVCDAKASQHNGDVVGSLHGDHPRRAASRPSRRRRRRRRAPPVPVSAASPPKPPRRRRTPFEAMLRARDSRAGLSAGVSPETAVSSPRRSSHQVPRVSATLSQKTAAQSGRAA